MYWSFNLLLLFASVAVSLRVLRVSQMVRSRSQSDFRVTMAPRAVDVETGVGAEVDDAVMTSSSVSSPIPEKKKVVRRKRPSFEKILKCLIIYNELKTGNRAKAISRIHRTPDDLVIKDLVLPSLRRFKGDSEQQQHQHDDDDEKSKTAGAISLFLLMTPNKNFVVPEDDDRWPQDCAGIHLGQVVADIRRKRSFKRESQVEVLNSLHFPWKATSARFAHVLEGLAIYKAQYGARPLEHNFMVPVVSGTKGAHGLLSGEYGDGYIDGYGDGTGDGGSSEEREGGRGKEAGGSSATFDPLVEQQSMWRRRQQSGRNVASKDAGANEKYMAARAKAVEDSPWPVHLMGFHLGKALRLLVEDITLRYAKCSPAAAAAGGSEELSNDGTASSFSSPSSSISFAASAADGQESLLEIAEQVRLLQMYGVSVDLSDGRLEEARRAIEEGELGQDGTPRDSITAGGGGVASDGTERGTAPTTAASAASTSSSDSATVTGRRRQGRPRRTRDEDDYASSEPVTLAGAVKLARERDLLMRERMREAKEETMRRRAVREQERLDAEESIATAAAAAMLSTDGGTAEEGSSGGFDHSATATNRSDSEWTDSSKSPSTLSLSASSQQLSSDDIAQNSKQKRSRTVKPRSDRFPHLLEALQVYFDIHGDHQVPVQFIVSGAASSDDRIDDGEEGGGGRVSRGGLWPAHLRGFPLGKELSRVLSSLKELKPDSDGRSSDDNNQCSPETVARLQALQAKKEALEALGVPLLKRRDQNFQLILAALKTHDEFFGDLLVPRYFTVPDEEPWPRETWGMPLGHKVRNIRYRGAYSSSANRKQLREIGFCFDYMKEATAKPTEQRRKDLGQHWYDGAYELYDEKEEQDKNQK
jgi:hypothetical protein